MREALTKGVRPRSTVPRNTQYLDDAYNVRVSENGCTFLDRGPYQYQNLSGSIIWPFPAVYTLEDGGLLEIYDNSVWYNGVALSKYQAYDPNVSFQQGTLNNYWKLADFPNGWLVTNGQRMMFYMYASGVVYGDDFIRPRACCSWLGSRLVIGGSTNASMFDRISSLEALDYPAYTGDGVFIGTPGGGVSDAMMLLNHDWATYGALSDHDVFGPENPYWKHRLRPGQFEYLGVPGVGDTYGLHCLDDIIVVLGSYGVRALAPVSVGENVAFSVIEGSLANLPGVFPSNGKPYAGDSNTLFFLDNERKLCRIGRDLNAERLGYDSIDVSVSDCVMTYNRVEGDLYFGDATHGYLLTRHGLSRISTLPTSIFNRSDGVASTQHTVALDDYGEIVTQPFALDAPGVCESVTVHGTMNFSHRHRVALDYKLDAAANDWERTSWVELDARSTARFGTPGIEFRVVVRNNDMTGKTFENISIDVSTDGRPGSREWLDA